MKYSEFSTEIIIEHEKYRKICNCFFELAKDSESKMILEQLLYNGGINNYSLNSGMPCKNNVRLERIRRISMAYLYITNPDTFKAFVENDINIFHGVNIKALPSILKYGLNSVDEMLKNDIPVLTGETWSRIEDKRNFISFTDILETATNYASLYSGDDEDLSFGAIIGTSKSEMEGKKIISVSSDFSEFGVESYFSLENIKCLCVPTDKVEFVKELVDNKILVLKIDNQENKFYYADDITLDYDNLLFEKLKKINSSGKSPKR